MRVIAKKALRDFWIRRPDAEQALKAWHAEAEHSTWKSPADVEGKYGTASILKRNRVVFNIGGNKYRLVVKINYHCAVVFVRFIGTHREYDGINAEEV